MMIIVGIIVFFFNRHIIYQGLAQEVQIDIIVVARFILGSILLMKLLVAIIICSTHLIGYAQGFKFTIKTFVKNQHFQFWIAKKKYVIRLTTSCSLWKSRSKVIRIIIIKKFGPKGTCKLHHSYYFILCFYNNENTLMVNKYII
jgi:hypothetical protein